MELWENPCCYSFQKKRRMENFVYEKGCFNRENFVYEKGCFNRENFYATLSDVEVHDLKIFTYNQIVLVCVRLITTLLRKVNVEYFINEMNHKSIVLKF
jgi:hypothetical protein